MVSVGIHDLNYNKIIQHIFELDKSIICAAIANLANGKIIATKYKEDAMLRRLTRQESELLTMQSLIRMGTRRTLEYKLGRALYSSTVYENVSRASISLSNEQENECGDDSILMLTFDKNADHEGIIKSKILPFLNDTRKKYSVVSN
jgi:hypothetical protein